MNTQKTGEGEPPAICCLVQRRWPTAQRHKCGPPIREEIKQLDYIRFYAGRTRRFGICTRGKNVHMETIYNMTNHVWYTEIAVLGLKSTCIRTIRQTRDISDNHLAGIQTRYLFKPETVLVVETYGHDWEQYQSHYILCGRPPTFPRCPGYPMGVPGTRTLSRVRICSQQHHEHASTGTGPWYRYLNAAEHDAWQHRKQHRQICKISEPQRPLQPVLPAVSLHETRWALDVSGTRLLQGSHEKALSKL